MGALARWMYGREYIKLLLHWRWLVLAIAIPVSLVIELIEEQGTELHLLDEVFIDGIVLPVTTWVVLTFAARRMAAQFEREAALERRQQFTQRLSEHREYYDLAHFLVRFPTSIFPLDHTVLRVLDPAQQHLGPVTQWGAAGVAPREAPDYCLVLVHDNLQIGVLDLYFPAGRHPSPEQRAQLLSYAPDMAAALARACADHQRAEQSYREARAFERRRLTQELHDSLAQQVFYLHLGLDQLMEEHSLTENEAVRRRLASMREVAAEVYDQIRHNLSILRAWEQVNLSEALTELARVTARNADMTAAVSVQGEPGWLSPHSCEQIYSVVREALNNVVKHAGARHVQLELAWSAEQLAIRLQDDGAGFDLAQGVADGHYGLALMRETVDALGGELQIASGDGQGTSLRVAIPLDSTQPTSGPQRQVGPVPAALNLLP